METKFDRVNTFIHLTNAKQSDGLDLFNDVLDKHYEKFNCLYETMDDNIHDKIIDLKCESNDDSLVVTFKTRDLTEAKEINKQFVDNRIKNLKQTKTNKIHSQCMVSTTIIDDVVEVLIRGGNEVI